MGTTRKILVVGSSGLRDWENRKEYAEACELLGKALAAAGHTIILGSKKDNEDTIDRCVLEGANSVAGRHKVIVLGSEKERPLYQKMEKELEHIDLIRKTDKSPPWGRAYQINQADGVILVGGALGTNQAGFTAVALERPVLAIRKFGGGAQEVWNAIHERYNDKELGNFSEEAVELQSDWDLSVARKAVHLAERLIDASRPKGKLLDMLLFAVVAVVLLGVWAEMFFRPSPATPLYFFIMLGVSALIGTALRTAVELNGDESAQLSWRRALKDVITGLLLAFGLILVYLAGGIAFVGDSEFLKRLQNATEFQRTAIGFSVVGISAAFLMETTTQKLKSLLAASIGDKPGITPGR